MKLRLSNKEAFITPQLDKTSPIHIDVSVDELARCINDSPSKNRLIGKICQSHFLISKSDVALIGKLLSDKMLDLGTRLMMDQCSPLTRSETVEQHMRLSNIHSQLKEWQYEHV